PCSPGFQDRRIWRFGPGFQDWFFSCCPALGESNCIRVLVCARGAGDGLSLFDCLDLAPVMRRGIYTTIASVRECQEEQTWLAILGIPPTTALCNADEAQRLCLAGRRCDLVMRDTVIDEILLRDRQPAIVVAAVVRVFDLESVDDSSGRKRKHPPRGAFKHFD